MKKIHLLIPTILTTTIAPIIALSSCGGNGDPTVEEPTFTIDSSKDMESKTRGVIKLDWTPTDHSIVCSEFEFTYSDGMRATVTPGTQGDRPLSLTLDFSHEISQNITDGTLKFHYEDSTTGLKNNKTINNIVIRAFDPKGLNVVCNELSTFTDERFSGKTYDVVQSKETSVTSGKATTFGVDLKQYGDDIQDTASIFFGVKTPFWSEWTLLGTEVENIGPLYLGDLELKNVEGSGEITTYWIEIHAPDGGWKAAISASDDGFLTGSYTFSVDFSTVVLMFGQLQTA